MKDFLKLPLPLILASKSPRRKKLLEQIGLSFSIIESKINEDSFPINSPPSDYAKNLAEFKANAIASKINYPALVIGADTIVVIDGKILNKPNDTNNAIEMLNQLSGRTHTVYTAISIVESNSDFSLTDIVATDVTFRTLTQKEIIAYVSTRSPLDKAGAYGIQDDFGAVFVSHINGCYYNIVGLPLELLYRMLLKYMTTKK